MRKIDVNMLIKNQGKYIALNKGETKILASDFTIQGLEKKLKEMHEKDAVIMFIPPIDKYLSPLCQS